MHMSHAHAHAHAHASLTPVSGTLVPIARYIDWITTTPILMCPRHPRPSSPAPGSHTTPAPHPTPDPPPRYELSHLAHASTANTMMLVGSDILMIAAGILSACLDRERSTG